MANAASVGTEVFITAATRALAIPEILDLVVGHLAVPGPLKWLFDDGRSEWLASDIATRAVNSQWKEAVDKVFLLPFLDDAACLDIYFIPIAGMRLLASIPEQLHLVQNLSAKSLVEKASPYAPAIFVACWQNLRCIDLDLQSLCVLSLDYAANPHPNFHNLATLNLDLRCRRSSDGYASVQYLRDIAAFLGSLTNLTSVSFCARTYGLGAEDIEEALPWYQVLIMLAVPSWSVEQVTIGVSAGSAIPDAQLGQILGHFAPFRCLTLHLMCYMHFNHVFPPSIEELDIRCYLNVIPNILQVLARTEEVPLLKKLPKIKGHTYYDPAFPGSAEVSQDLVRRALQALKARGGITDLETTGPELYGLVRSAWDSNVSLEAEASEDSN